MENSEAILVAAHRGLSSLLPQNTIQALLSACFVSDLVQFDLAITKDDKVVIFHDRGLKRITNIEQFAQFKDRKKVETIDYYHKEQEDWWLRDFTYQELRKLKIKQTNPKRPSFTTYNFYIPLFQEFIECWIKLYQKYHKDYKIGGLLIELKEQIADQQTHKDLLLMSQVNFILKKYHLNNNLSGFPPVIIQTFFIPMLRHLQTQNQRVLLYDQHIKITKQLLSKDMKPNCIGVGVSQGNLKTLQDEKTVKEICDEMQLRIFYWTISDDVEQRIPFKAQNYYQLYLQLKKRGVSGFISDFPQNCMKYLKKENMKITEVFSLLSYDGIK